MRAQRKRSEDRNSVPGELNNCRVRGTRDVARGTWGAVRGARYVGRGTWGAVRGTAQLRGAKKWVHCGVTRRGRIASRNRANRQRMPSETSLEDVGENANRYIGSAAHLEDVGKNANRERFADRPGAQTNKRAEKQERL